MTRPRLSITKDLLIEKEIMGYDNHVTVMFKENDEIKSGFYKACNKHSYPQLLTKPFALNSLDSSRSLSCL